MKKGIIYPKSLIHTDKNIRDGESIEEKLRKMVAGQEPIQATAKIGYSERKEGVHAEYDIRTDRFELAMMASDKVHASQYAARMNEDGFIQAPDGTWQVKPQDVTGEA